MVHSTLLVLAMSVSLAMVVYARKWMVVQLRMVGATLRMPIAQRSMHPSMFARATKDTLAMESAAGKLKHVRLIMVAAQTWQHVSELSAGEPTPVYVHAMLAMKVMVLFASPSILVNPQHLRWRLPLRKMSRLMTRVRNLQLARIPLRAFTAVSATQAILVMARSAL
jgi:hypothetical protein